MDRFAQRLVVGIGVDPRFAYQPRSRPRGEILLGVVLGGFLRLLDLPAALAAFSAAARRRFLDVVAGLFDPGTWSLPEQSLDAAAHAP
jgi:hypothetical protein